MSGAPSPTQSIQRQLELMEAQKRLDQTARLAQKGWHSCKDVRFTNAEDKTMVLMARYQHTATGFIVFGVADGAWEGNLRYAQQRGEVRADSIS